MADPIKTRRRASSAQAAATSPEAQPAATLTPAAHTSPAAQAARDVIPDKVCESFMVDLEAAVRVAALCVDRDASYPAACALDVVENRLLPGLRSRLAALDFGRALGGFNEAESKAASDVFEVQALVILAANAKGGRPDLARIVLRCLQDLANHALPDCAHAKEPPDPTEWLAHPGASLATDRAQLAPVLDPAASTPEAFRRGMALALAMMRHAGSLEDPEAASARRRHRNGRPQLRFAEAYLRELLAEPALIEGFSAVMSAGLVGDLESGCVCLPDWQDVPAAEYAAGRPGDDGTEADDEARPSAQCATVP